MRFGTFFSFLFFLGRRVKRISRALKTDHKDSLRGFHFCIVKHAYCIDTVFKAYSHFSIIKAFMRRILQWYPMTILNLLYIVVPNVLWLNIRISIIVVCRNRIFGLRKDKHHAILGEKSLESILFARWANLWNIRTFFASIPWSNKYNQKFWNLDWTTNSLPSSILDIDINFNIKSFLLRVYIKEFARISIQWSTQNITDSLQKIDIIGISTNALMRSRPDSIFTENLHRTSAISTIG